MMESKRRVVYVYDDELVSKCDKLPPVENRASMVNSLISSYGLLRHVRVAPALKATADDLKTFHSSSFVDYMKNAGDLSAEDADDEQLEYGLCYDCPPFEDIYDTMLTVAGGSLAAASHLLSGSADVAINWCGGWHHAQRDGAEGFCYVNDVVICIEKLKEKFKRILYIDLDIHHGNGVENAFAFSKSVFTLSFHKFEPGFYPGTGNVDDVGCGHGRGYACNVPVKEGFSDASLEYLFHGIAQRVFEAYSPNAIVVQCGGDSLNGDPLGESNLTPSSLSKCVRRILNWNVPAIFLGGGGYNFANTARLWTYLTATIINKEDELSTDIPDNDFFFEYGPDYRLPITKGCQKDTNNREDLDRIIQIIEENLKKYNLDCT